MLSLPLVLTAVLALSSQTLAQDASAPADAASDAPSGTNANAPSAPPPTSSPVPLASSSSPAAPASSGSAATPSPSSGPSGGAIGYNDSIYLSGTVGAYYPQPELNLAGLNILFPRSGDYWVLNDTSDLFSVAITTEWTWPGPTAKPANLTFNLLRQTGTTLGANASYLRLVQQADPNYWEKVAYVDNGTYWWGFPDYFWNLTVADDYWIAVTECPSAKPNCTWPDMTVLGVSEKFSIKSNTSTPKIPDLWTSGARSVAEARIAGLAAVAGAVVAIASLCLV